MLELTLKRLVSDQDSTLGVLHIGDKFQCFTLEDAYQETKLAGRTRIPAGSYRLAARSWGGVLESHKRRWGHSNVYEICEVQDFTDVLIHCGNTHEDTRGCVLVGATANAVVKDFSIGNSRMAYQDLYLCLAHRRQPSPHNLTIFDEMSQVA